MSPSGIEPTEVGVTEGFDWRTGIREIQGSTRGGGGTPLSKANRPLRSRMNKGRLAVLRGSVQLGRGVDRRRSATVCEFLHQAPRLRIILDRYIILSTWQLFINDSSL